MKAYITAPVTLAMIYRAWSHKSLTPAGIIAATITAVIHAIHPSNIPFTLLIVFFLAGTTVTKVKHNVKARLTIQSTGTSGGEGARTHVQVLANSGVASVLILMHVYQLYRREKSGISTGITKTFPWNRDLLLVGIIANYAAVAADTFSSELGILAKSKPRLITSRDFRKVPPGTNGGVTWGGLVAGFFGSMLIVTVAMGLSFSRNEADMIFENLIEGLPITEPQFFTWGMTIWGMLGSVLDSLLGGWLQQSVVDTRSCRIVEGAGGKSVLLMPTDQTGHSQDKKKEEQPSRKVESGLSILDNNEVNFVMALTMSLGAMGLAAQLWDIPFESVLKF
ncbi:integral membrane protein DUF92-domain-containing protein [Calycina marina]|uniref:Integral membrane protein DUF92-domain-containing protein n=1 Tax=Calycina marina TaxID=1763456 RepID=A0A9P7YY19_9HELO|nr:integral membrane protein DUF92-domain-containing protein [Calycina marina]